MLRAGRRLEGAYQQILHQLPRHDWLSVDETGWRIGGQSAWLHMWVGAQAVAYAIDPQRSADRLEAVIGIDWTGILVRARELEKDAVDGAGAFPRRVIELCQASLATSWRPSSSGSRS